MFEFKFFFSKVTTETQRGSKTHTSFLLLISCENLGKVLYVPVSSSRKQIMRVGQVKTVSSPKCWPLNLIEGKEQHLLRINRPTVFIPSSVCPLAPNFALLKK